MLVYANYLELRGKDSYKVAFSAVCGWLKKKTNTTLRTTDLLGSNKFSFENVWVTTETANFEEPHLFAITVKHPDDSVRGRQWVVEIGIRTSGDDTSVSVVLKTDEMSSLVKADVFTTRPLLVRYIVENAQLAPETPGISCRRVESKKDSYRALLFDIERIERDYPIVLVSPNRNGEYGVDVQRLQEQLTGLAQVVEISNECNSYDMAEILSQRFSAWNGAVNVIYTPFKNGHIRNKLFQSNYLEDKFSTDKDTISFLLSTVTHNTNIPKIRKQIRSEGVKAKSLKERFLSRTNNKEAATSEDIEEILEIAASQETQFKADIERIELEKLQVEEDKDNFEKELNTASWNIESLKRQLQGAGGNANGNDPIKLLLAACRVDDPTPEECIGIIKSALSEKVVFLDTSVDSARSSTTFKKGRILLDMLRKLVTEYLPLYLQGGDNKARSVFTNNQYAANESESVVNNPEMAKTREFIYKGERVNMWQHIKVGITDNPDLTIRVHFLVDTEDEKIVIGYCGEHLPLPGR